MSDTIPGTRPTRQGAEEVKGGLRAWTIGERYWTEHILRKLNQWENLAPDYESAEKLLKLGGLLKASGVELPEADPATGFEPPKDRPREIFKSDFGTTIEDLEKRGLKVKLADTSGPGTESGAPEIWRDGGPTLTQRDGPATEPAKPPKWFGDAVNQLEQRNSVTSEPPKTISELPKTDQQRWDASMARAEALQQRAETMFAREERMLLRFEALLEQADLLLLRIVAREAGLRVVPWRENKATVGTIPTEQTSNPLIPSGSTSSYPKLKRSEDNSVDIGAPLGPNQQGRVRTTITDATEFDPSKSVWRTGVSHGKLKQEMTDGELIPKPEPTGPETASQRIRELEERIKAMQQTIEDLHGQLASMENVNHKRRELGDRLIQMAKELEKWRNE